MNNVLRILLDDDISDIILSKKEQEKAGVYEMTPEAMEEFVRLGEIFS